MSKYLSITFDGEAHQSFRNTVQSLPEGYNVCVLPPGVKFDEDGGEWNEHDVQLTGRTDGDGLVVLRIDPLTGEGVGDPVVLPWDDVDRVHIY